MTKLTQTSWLGGQMDVRMTGRQDMANYRNGASVLKNFVPVKLGSIRKRPGTDLVSDLSDWVEEHDFRMVPFGFLGGEGYVLVFCPDATGDKARAYRTKAATSGDGSTAAGSGSYVPVSGAVHYLADELGEIGYVQCGDILFLAHKNHPPAKISHYLNGSTHTFVYSEIAFNPVTTKPSVGTPEMTRQFFEDFTFSDHTQNVLNVVKSRANFLDPDDNWTKKYNEIYTDEDLRIYSGKTVVKYRASVVVDGSEGPLSDDPKIPEQIPDSGVTRGPGYVAFTSPWTESQVVTIPVWVTIPSEAKEWEIRLYKENGGVYGLIGSWKGSAPGYVEHNFKDDNIAPDTSETPMDETGGTPFLMEGSYPGSVGLYQQRLAWAGSWDNPARIWMSRAGDLYEYRPHVRLQTDDAIDFILPITQFANINFIVELGRLFAFTECTELVIGSASTTQGISYETIVATEHSHLGCTKRLPPIIANNTLLFVNRTGQSVRDYDEQLGSQRFGGTDVSVFSARIFADNPIVDWTWQQEPNSTVWCVLKDGRLASFTYDREQKIAAWAVHGLGGGGKVLGIAKTCAVFGRDAAHPTTGEVMVAVERGEGEARRVTLERMRPWGAADGDEADRLCMDAVETMLAGEIEGLGSGVYHVGYVWFCPDGRTSVCVGYDNDAGDWVFAVGYTFESVMTTMPPAIGSEGGASQFDVKLGQHAHLRTVGSWGGEIYAVGMKDQAARIDDGAVRDGEDGAEFRDVDVVLAGSNNRDGRVTVRHNEPWPFQLALLELDYEVES